MDQRRADESEWAKTRISWHRPESGAHADAISMSRDSRRLELVSNSCRCT